MIKKGISYIGILFLYGIACLPMSFLYALSSLLYYPLYYVVGYRKKVVRENLALSFPEKTLLERLKIEKQYFQYLVDLMLEVVKTSKISKREMEKMVQFENFELIEKYFKEGKSILASTGHVGNWELCVVALSAKLRPKQNKVIYKPLSNPTFENWFFKLRSRFGNDMITMRQTLRSVVASKNEQTIYCFAGDQSPVRSEVQYTLNFLNQPTAVLLGLEKIALQTNRPIIYFDVKWVKRGKYIVKVKDLIERPQDTNGHEITDKFFEVLEETIRNQPVHWLWSHRRWKLNK